MYLQGASTASPSSYVTGSHGHIDVKPKSKKASRGFADLHQGDWIVIGVGKPLYFQKDYPSLTPCLL